MGATADKVKGAANEAIGKAKQGVGEATGSDRLQGEGAIQEAKGKGQQALGDAKQATKDAVNRAFEGPLSEGLRHERLLFQAAFATEGQKEGMHAFVNKRAPVFRNR